MTDDIDINELKSRALAIVEIYSDLNRMTGREADILKKAITMDRPQGEWVHRDAQWDTCSNCGLGFRDLCLDGFKFCPYCGAEMKEGDK